MSLEPSTGFREISQCSEKAPTRDSLELKEPTSAFIRISTGYCLSIVKFREVSLRALLVTGPCSLRSHFLPTHLRQVKSATTGIAAFSPHHYTIQPLSNVHVHWHGIALTIVIQDTDADFIDRWTDTDNIYYTSHFTTKMFPLGH